VRRQYSSVTLIFTSSAASALAAGSAFGLAVRAWDGSGLATGGRAWCGPGCGSWGLLYFLSLHSCECWCSDLGGYAVSIVDLTCCDTSGVTCRVDRILLYSVSDLCLAWYRTLSLSLSTVWWPGEVALVLLLVLLFVECVCPYCFAAAVLVESGLRFRDDPRARLHLAVLCCGPAAPRGLTFFNPAHQVCATLLSEAEVCCSTLHPKRNSRLFCQRPGSFPKDTTRPLTPPRTPQTCISTLHHAPTLHHAYSPPHNLPPHNLLSTPHVLFTSTYTLHPLPTLHCASLHPYCPPAPTPAGHLLSAAHLLSTAHLRVLSTAHLLSPPRTHVLSAPRLLSACLPLQPPSLGWPLDPPHARPGTRLGAGAHCVS